jgi:O-antigen/teichoic acid export membrane protein
MRMAAAATAQQGVAAAVAIVVGAVNAPVNGLLVGRLAGVFSNAAVLFREIRGAFNSYRKDWRFADSLRAMVRYKQFAFFNLPYSVVGSFSREFVVFSFMFSGAVEAAGLYGLVRSALAAPISFLSASLSQVYYREAADRSTTAEFAQLTFRLLMATALAMAPPLALVSIWGPDIFAFVFGEQWREAGRFAQLLALPTLLSVMTSWPERIFEVRARQSWSFAIQIGFDVLSIASLALALGLGAAPITAIGIYAVVQAVYHLSYLSAVFALVPLPPSRFFTLIGSVLVACATMWGFNELVSHLTPHALAQFLSGAVAAALLSTCAAVPVWRRIWNR